VEPAARLDHAEYTVLRETIASRGSLRPVMFLAGLSAWALALTLVLIWLPNPAGAVVPLVILAGTYEAIRALHVGVERIGRYLQVFHEEAMPADGPSWTPAWERTAMAFGPVVPGAGVHPYFFAIFLVATCTNFLAVVLPGPLPIELAGFSVPHGAFLTWMVYCERGMRRQRAEELTRFRQLRDSGASAPS
jgi:hypothetical protein